VHSTWLAGVQLPPWHESPSVHGLASLHFTPSALAGFEQMPVAVSQTPATWHWSLALQTTCPPPTHSPTWQVSVAVQASPSLHGLLAGFSGFVQAPVSLHVGNLDLERERALQLPVVQKTEW